MWHHKACGGGCIWSPQGAGRGAVPRREVGDGLALQGREQRGLRAKEKVAGGMVPAKEGEEIGEEMGWKMKRKSLDKKWQILNGQGI